ncbi:hypothetical protein [Paenibacillus alkalitolerans]|uniref:hypothetical protein n=1 Tax=Paenibacillus alkalitolerans TaxID=2799335 RepID=UPI0018F487DF|nr:hypothetical protein [Paenibacillus alkalitolerans]
MEKPSENTAKQGEEFIPHETNAGFGDQGFETDVPGNYENELAGTPKSMTGFDKKAPGRLG